MEIDGRGMRILDSAACASLLGTVRLGRLALTDRALPIILPVNFEWFDNSIAFRVGQGVVSRAAQSGQIVCFEADDVNEDSVMSWSVYAIGQLDVVDDPADVSRLHRLDLGGWSGSDNTYIQLRPQLFSGRTSVAPNSMPGPSTRSTTVQQGGDVSCIQDRTCGSGVRVG